MKSILIFIALALIPMRAQAAPANRAAAEEYLRWQAAEQRVDADLQTWPLRKILETIATATGWQVYVEPGTEQKVSVKFKALPPTEALAKLLGRLNFMVTPGTNGLTAIHVFRTSRDNATQIIRPPVLVVERARSLIPNELVVRVKPGTDIDDLARQLGAKVTGRADALQTYRLEFTDEEAALAARATLADRGDISGLDSNYSIERPVVADNLATPGTASFNLKPVATGDANRLVIGLIDAPVQSLGPTMDPFILKSLSAAGESTPGDTSPTHGTSMAETILKAIALSSDASSSRARILPVDVYGSHATTSTFDVAYGIYLAINNGANIINLSLGSDGNSAFLHNVISTGSKQGVLFFGAAGNEPVATPTYPAAYPEVVAVTAGDKNGNIAGYANHGDFIDAVAPGSTIVYYGGRSYYVSGTSASTAYTSGLAAGLTESSGRPLSAAPGTITSSFAPKTGR